MKITILAVGKARATEIEWINEYKKRLGPSLIIHELSTTQSLPPALAQKTEAQLLLKAIPVKSFIVLLDERGHDITSREFATKFSSWQDQGVVNLVFIIGGANGVLEDVRRKADFIISFGHQTWPHRLVRVMLLEQIYRAKQIIAGHPYHRE